MADLRLFVIRVLFFPEFQGDFFVAVEGGKVAKTVVISIKTVCMNMDVRRLPFAPFASNKNTSKIQAMV